MGIVFKRWSSNNKLINIPVLWAFKSLVLKAEQFYKRKKIKCTSDFILIMLFCGGWCRFLCLVYIYQISAVRCSEQMWDDTTTRYRLSPTLLPITFTLLPIFGLAGNASKTIGEMGAGGMKLPRGSVTNIKYP